MEIQISSISELTKAAENLLKFAGEERVFLFFGEMGAGKTTLIKELCNVLQVKDTASSPTFSIVNEYDSANGPVFHFDFYRLKHETEALDLGYEDYFYSGNYCFIEWPEKIAGLLPDKSVNVKIVSNNNEERIISANKN